MSPETRKKINAELSSLALIEHFSTDRAAAPIGAHEHRPEPVAVIAHRLLTALGA